MILLSVLIFVQGYLLGEKAHYKSMIDELLVTQDMYVSDQSMEVNLLTRIYKNYESSPSMAKEELKRYIAMKYTKKEQFKYFDSAPFTAESGIYQTNKDIEDFLRMYPLNQCKDLPQNEAVKCSIDNYLNFD